MHIFLSECMPLEKSKNRRTRMIDIDALDKFLDESNELIKKTGFLDGIAQCRPLCSFRIAHSPVRKLRNE